MKSRAFRAVAVVWFALVCSVSFAAGDSNGGGAPTGKLPHWVVPQNYAIALRVDPAAARFQGRAQIRVRLKKAADHVWLNGEKLQVTRARVTDAHGKTHSATYTEIAPRVGVARLDFKQTLPAQELTLDLTYHAPLNHRLRGLYQVTYQGDAYAMTQMEALSARYAFPGFDEPDFKTPFALELTVPEDQRALANTAALATRKAGHGWKTVTFAKTRPLPTYLVAYAIGPWDVVDAPPIGATPARERPVPLRGVAARNKGPLMRRALDQTPAIIKTLEHYFAFGYPFDKLDIVAAPDFAAGAMENAGFVTFRDWLMLLNVDSPARDVRGSFNVEAHELAHQWTGDTVTMDWWNDLWLNEAFATWMQQKITAKLHPEYHADLDRISGAQYAMANDSLASARRIRQPIAGSGDISNAFDSITYQKGAAVLGMFEAFVGDDVFRAGMRDYLHAHVFATATAEDLIGAIAGAADRGRSFEKAFNSFLTQSGVPVVSTQLVKTGEQTVLRVHQQRYLPLGSRADAARTWGIPICVRYSTDEGSDVACKLIADANGRIVLEHASAHPWVFANADGDGYYRVTLSKSRFAELTAHIDRLNDREQLAYADAVDAAFAAGRASADIVLRATRALARSRVPAVATAPIDRLEWIARYQAATPRQRAALRRAVDRAYGERMDALGYRRVAGESTDAVELRSALADFLGIAMGIPRVRAALAAQGKTVLAVDQGKPLDFSAADPDLLSAALTAAIRAQGAAAVHALMQALKHNGDPAQRNAMLEALAATRDPQLLEQVRDFALGADVKVGEMDTLLEGRYQSTANRVSMWPWFTAHFDRIVDRTGAFSAGRLPELAAAGACRPRAADRLQAFFKPRLDRLVGVERGLAQTVESIRLCAALKADQKPAAIMQAMR